MPLQWRIQHLDQTISTNDDARSAAEAGESEGYVVTAKQQSAGRGRQGRVWESQTGNLFCSILLQPKDMPAAAGFYSFIAALAVRDVVMSALPQAAITLKWPNDVLVGGKKISGILLEVSGDRLIIGIGLNVAHYPENALYPATSLAQEGAAQKDLTVLLNRLLERLGHWHDIMQKENFAPIRAAWLLHARQGPLTVRTPQETLQGQFAGLTENGHLRLLLEGGAERSISTGDVFAN